MTTRHRNSKSHKKSLRNRVRKSGGKIPNLGITTKLGQITNAVTTTLGQIPKVPDIGIKTTLNQIPNAVTTTAKNAMAADYTGACKRCTYTFTPDEQKQVLALLKSTSTEFNAQLSFVDGKLQLK